ncbi:lytic transglycosylase domain-containing protein [Herbiconiux sp. UC225_62]|uniref:lytic transglycosylase domain-containing protein n=1 Tax=Herbiconiux sp. UC225_62 TaxID=3350168 RepID=UPI0036D4228B
MTARVGLGLLIAALTALAAWLVVGAVSASAEPRTTTDAWAAADAVVTAPLVPGGAAAVENGDAGGGTGDATGGTGDAAAAGAAAPAAGASVTVGPEAPAGTPAAVAAVDAVDPSWAAGVARATGIPQRAVVGYAAAALALSAEQPTCGLGWNTIAALGWIESGHGTHAGSSIGATDGVAAPRILGPALDGGEFDAIDDTDAGALDGDVGGDRAVGPMQFIPSTWQTWGADGSGDGVADPQQIDDASLAAARYLCHYGDLTDAVTWRTAVFAYNHVESYVDSVAATANQYAAQVAAVSPSSGAGG